MVRKNIVVIRVVTLEDQTLLRMHGDLIEAYYPALRTDSYCIGEQPRGVCDLKTKTLAVPKIIALAKKHQDADAIVISCCDDPAVEELREMLCSGHRCRNGCECGGPQLGQTGGNYWNYRICA